MKAIMEKIMDTALRCIYCPEPPGTDETGDCDKGLWWLNGDGL